MPLLAAQFDQRPAVLPFGPYLLPQRPHLLRGRSAEEAFAPVPLCLERFRVSIPGALGERSRPKRAFSDGRPKTPNLSTRTDCFARSKQRSADRSGRRNKI